MENIDYTFAIGMHVMKESKKPFKSRSVINTVKGIIDHPILHIPAYTFNEDDSYVECRRCETLKNNPDRSRYYGLDLLDRVSLESFSKGSLFGTVIMLSILDNNRVYIKLDSGEIISHVAEWCKRID